MVAPVNLLNPAAAAAAAPASPLAGLQPGDVIAARVVALLENDQVQLMIGNTVVGATTQVPLPLGATVQLAVQTTGTATTLQFVGQTAPQTATAQAATGQTVAAQGAAVPQAAALPPVAPPPAPRPPAAAIAVPAGGDAPNGINGSAGTPTVASVVATTAVTDATALAAPPELPLAAAPQLAPAPAADPTIALQAAVRTAAATQGSLAPLFAEIAAAVNLPTLPEPVEREAMRLLSLRPQLDGNLAAGDLKQAFANSGLFLEAQLAESAQSSGSSSANASAGAGAGVATNGAEAAGTAAAAELPQSDLKAALMVFRQVLATALTEGEGPSTVATTAAPSGVATPPAAAQAAEASSPTARGAPAASPPPPYRDGPTSPQPPAVATIDAATPPHEAVQTLMAATDGALARQTLLQAASLPGQPGGPNHVDNGGPRWHFEVPFATPQGTNVAQFEISRDGQAAKRADAVGPAWQARFSVDVDPIGPVHAQIALRGAHAAVTLWAERPEGAARLRAGAAKLTDALRAADLDAGDLVVRDGAPRTRAMPAGHFLDRAS